MSRNKNFSERRQLVHKFARSGVRFEPSLIRAFAQAFGCNTVSIYHDLRAIESETGCLLVNVSRQEPEAGKR